MKDIFLAIRKKLISIESINWVDLNKGQINNYEARPAIDFPAVLLSIAMPRTTKLSRKEQQCDITVTADVVFDCLDDTDSITPNEALDKSLSIYDTTNDVYKALQGDGLEGILRSPLERIGQQDPRRSDKLKVIQLVFTAKYIDTSAN